MGISMLSTVGNLALKPTEPPARTLLTPGQLYRLLSSDFRRHRPPRCTCRMPMIAMREPPSDGAANWVVEGRRTCGHCADLVAELVSRYAQVYDMIA
jgi:hypothetical protein